MFGYAKLFRSRWWALLWSAGIIWTAIEVSSPDEASPSADNSISNAATE